MNQSIFRDRVRRLACRFPPLDPFASRANATTALRSLRSEAAADLNEVVGHDSKTDPPLHTFEPSISTAIQSVAPLQNADAALASGPPALSGPEPTRSLQFFPLAALGAPTRHRDSRHSHSLDGLLIR